MKKMTSLAALMLSVFCFLSCGSSFRDLAKKNGFNSGYAITAGDFLDPETSKIIKNDCNILVYENSMKWINLRPKVNYWSWSDIDSLIKYAEENKITVKWHTLFWHQQNSPFISSSWTRDQALKMMDEHISMIMTRYKGKIAEYDVVNEMFEEDGSMRKSIWYNTIGPDYIEHALIKAHEIDPDAKLYLNEYNNEEMGHPKADAMYKMVKDFKERGIPIDGIGMQLHLDATLKYSENAIRENIKRYNDLGLEVSFSEVDIRIPTNNPAAYEKAQEDMYLMLYRLAKESPNVKSVITWGISDRHSWVPSAFSGKGSALLYDKYLKPKAVYKAIEKELRK